MPVAEAGDLGLRIRQHHALGIRERVRGVDPARRVPVRKAAPDHGRDHVVIVAPGIAAVGRAVAHLDRSDAGDIVGAEGIITGVRAALTETRRTVARYHLLTTESE